ncbi:MAG: 4'-phosphopantetheinyl transferase superfamily protein [Sphingobium sp.]
MRARRDETGLPALFGAFGISATPLIAAGAPFPLWLVRSCGAPSASAGHLLSVAEGERAARFRTARLRDRYVTAHAALRLLCEHQFGVDAARQHFDLGDHGKPQLAGRSDAQCNMSYSGDHIVVAAGHGRPIGVDVERLRPIADAPGLIGEHYTPREGRALARVSRMGRGFDRAFLRVWVRKEACVKAAAKGLSIPLPDVQCGIGSQATTVRIGDLNIRTGVAHACDRDILPPGDLIIAWAQIC